MCELLTYFIRLFILSSVTPAHIKRKMNKCKRLLSRLRAFSVQQKQQQIAKKNIRFMLDIIFFIIKSAYIKEIVICEIKQ